MHVLCKIGTIVNPFENQARIYTISEFDYAKIPLDTLSLGFGMDFVFQYKCYSFRPMQNSLGIVYMYLFQCSLSSLVAVIYNKRFLMVCMGPITAFIILRSFREILFSHVLLHRTSIKVSLDEKL